LGALDGEEKELFFCGNKGREKTGWTLILKWTQAAKGVRCVNQKKGKFFSKVGEGGSQEKRLRSLQKSQSFFTIRKKKIGYC